MNCKDFLFVAFVFWLAGALSIWVGTLTGARLTKPRLPPAAPSTTPSTWKPPIPSHLRREGQMPEFRSDCRDHAPSPIDTIITPHPPKGRSL